ncbi:MAG: CocE/NonD family hydrolase [Solirubrobacteraceae bacterium]
MTAIVEALPRATTTRDDWITLSDGCRLYSRTVLPLDADRNPVPAVLEYLPYRLTDGTAHRDATQHPYFAGHGYAGVRVDIRGTGNSDGLLLDEYLPQEQLDGCEVIAWLAEQPWCSGAVGIYGKSWGGFNGLQIAARRPPALKAVISAYFTDDRYSDDVHYMGGCVLAHEALSWASYMLGINSLPPDPAIVGDRWRAIWLQRLERTPFFADQWLRHQRRDEFWQQGSICEDYRALEVPTLLVGGWADGYTNAVGRTLGGLAAAGVPVRALLGPWSHAWPEAAEPGPQIGFLQECLRWWDHWLRGIDNGAMDAPLIRAWIQDYDAPAAHHARRSGRWVSEQEWPPRSVSTRELFPRAGGALAAEPGGAAREMHVASELSGADAGAWCPYGEVTDFPPDQRAEDGLALSYTSAPLSDPLEIFGYPEVALRLTVDRPLALVAVRLCDVAPDGSSLLIARGLLNLTHRHSHLELQAMTVGEPTTVVVPLGLTGDVIAAGHRIRLAISSGYWPFAWPSPERVQLELMLGTATRLALPVRIEGAAEPGATPLQPPERAAPAAGFVRHTAWRKHERDVSSGRSTIEVGADDHARLDDHRLEFGDRTTQRLTLQVSEPLSARIDYDGQHFLSRGEWQVKVRLHTSMSATSDTFVVTRELDAYEGDECVHSARNAVEIPRDGV